jgi:hypothetical protein
MGCIAGAVFPSGGTLLFVLRDDNCLSYALKSTKPMADRYQEEHANQFQEAMDGAF